MNVYDIAFDFILLDAFDDIDHPPSAIVTVLSNTWITAGMKRSVSIQLPVVCVCVCVCVCVRLNPAQ